MSIVGYARVSSIGQNLEVQQEKLAAYGCDKVYEEKVSGTTANRTQLQAVLDYVRSGDTLVITKLDRLARSTFHLTQIADRLQTSGVDLEKFSLISFMIFEFKIFSKLSLFRFPINKPSFSISPP